MARCEVVSDHGRFGERGTQGRGAGVTEGRSKKLEDRGWKEAEEVKEVKEAKEMKEAKEVKEKKELEEAQEDGGKS